MIRRTSIGIFTGGALLIALLWAPPAEGQVYVRIAPPAPVVESPPPPPSPRHVWIGGYHRWNGRAYVWVPGHYASRPRAHSAWVPGHWVQHRRGWHWVRGHWR